MLLAGESIKEEKYIRFVVRLLQLQLLDDVPRFSARLYLCVGASIGTQKGASMLAWSCSKAPARVLVNGDKSESGRGRRRRGWLSFRGGQECPVCHYSIPLSSVCTYHILRNKIISIPSQ